MWSSKFDYAGSSQYWCGAYLLLLSLWGDSVLAWSWVAAAAGSDEDEDNLRLGWSWIEGGGVGQLVEGGSLSPAKLQDELKI